MDNFYENIEQYNLKKEPKISMIWLTKKKNHQQKVTELFIKGIKSNISFGFIAQSYFAVPKKY